MNYLVSSMVPPRFGNDSRDTVPTAAFQASDGPFYITYSNDRTYHRLAAQAMERPDLAEHPDFATHRMRVRNRDRLLAILRDVFATDTRTNWMRGCARRACQAARSTRCPRRSTPRR